MIETYAPPLLAGTETGFPAPSLFGWRVHVACDCAVYVGVRVDKGEAVCVAVACCDEHKPYMAAFNEAMAESCDNPTDLPLVTVVELILENVHPEAA